MTMQKPKTRPERHVYENIAAEYKAMQYDPLMLQAVMLIQASNHSRYQISQRSGVSTTTMANWEKR
jgi:hypothetical protein